MKTPIITCALMTAVTLCGGAVEMKLKWEPGKRYVFEQHGDSAAKVPLPGQGLVDTKMKMTLGMTHDASEHEAGTRVRVAMSDIQMRADTAGIIMEYDSNDPAKNAGALGAMMQPLAEAKFDTIFDAGGRLVETKGIEEIKAPGQLGFGQAELKALARQFAELMPEKEVNPGDTWDADVSLPLGGLGDDLALVYTLTFDALEEREGKQIAKVSITGKMKEGIEDDGETVLAVETKSITGVMFFDLALGQPIELRTTVDMEMSLPAGVRVEQGAPGRMPVKTLTVTKLVGVEEVPE